LCLKLTFSGTGVNLANNNGGGGMQNRSRLYYASRKTQGFHFAVFLPPNNQYENISTFFSCFPLFNSVSKKIFLGRKKYWRGICPPPCPPPTPQKKLHLCFQIKEEPTKEINWPDLNMCNDSLVPSPHLYITTSNYLSSLPTAAKALSVTTCLDTVCSPNYGGESGLLTKIQVLWDVEDRRWVNVVLPDATKNRNNYLQVQAVCLLGLFDPEHEGTATIRNIITIYRTTSCNSPEDLSRQATRL